MLLTGKRGPPFQAIWHVDFIDSYADKFANHNAYLLMKWK